MDPATIMKFLPMLMGGGKEEKKEPVNLHAGNEGYFDRLAQQRNEAEMSPVKMLIKKREKVEDQFS